ncbi:MAG: hypothetical protein P4L49_19205, partial [Desulfosporosinus sp.]|nr:hypothetical protein [Desulfosporosinus sp.]
MKGIGIPMSKLGEREAVAKRKRTIKTTVNDDNTEKTEQPQMAVQSYLEQTDKLIQRSYYLTDKLQKAITIRTAEGDFDKSGVVREALKLYLAD